MKKILLVSLLMLVGTSTQAGQAIALAGNATASSQVTVSTTTGATGCALLANSVNINLSAGNNGTIDCDITAVGMGVAIENSNGKGVVWSGGTVGGGIQSTTGQTLPGTAGGSPTQSIAATQSSKSS